VGAVSNLRGLDKLTGLMNAVGGSRDNCSLPRWNGRRLEPR
jgi:hypothetical protein